MEKDEQFMEKALYEARCAYDEGEVPIGAVIVHNDHIIARAHNLTEHLHDTTAHAEMQAITSATNQIGGKYLHDCTLYVTIEPCVMCAGALAWAQIGRIVYGAPDTKRGYSIFAPHALHKCTKVRTGVSAEQCKDLIQLFFEDKR